MSEPNWSLDDCVRRHDDAAAEEIRRYREDEMWRYRDRQQQETLKRKCKGKVATEQIDAYREVGRREIQMTPASRMSRSITLLIIFVLLMYLFRGG